MRHIITDQIKLSARPEGPLAQYLSSFAFFLKAQGYSRSTAHKQLCFTADFSHWLKQKNVPLQNLNSDHVKNYLRHRRRKGKCCRSVAFVLEHIICFLRDEGILPLLQVETPVLSPVEGYLREYETYLREDRALAETSIFTYIPCVRSFLIRKFGKKEVNLSKLHPHDMVEFIQYQASRLQKKRCKLMTCALRSFLNYARYRGEITLDLAAAVPGVAHWSRPAIPRAISADQVRELLDSIDQNTAIGLRDYAILLLLARLGFRACEIFYLELEGINWDAATLTVRTKGGRPGEYPLSDEVGQAIATYLQKARPNHPSRRVFLRAVAPTGPFRGASSIGAIVKHRLERTNIQPPTRGAHQFRHGFASDMLRQGASLGEIGDLLGHHHPQSTMIYAKTDIEALRHLAMPWPGELS